MKQLYFFVLACFAIVLASCGGKKSSEDVITPDSAWEEKEVGTDDYDDAVVEYDNDDDEYDSEDYDYDDDSYSSSSSSGSQDWDALLDSYDQYVDKYISYVKKAAKGDMSALAEYPSLMQKAQEFSEKMKGAQGDMSASQWARYIEITNKMTKAAQELQ